MSVFIFVVRIPSKNTGALKLRKVENLTWNIYLHVLTTCCYHSFVQVMRFQLSIVIIILGSPDLKRPNLTGISEKQGTCSRT